jgi:hypothetical protein
MGFPIALFVFGVRGRLNFELTGCSTGSSLRQVVLNVLRTPAGGHGGVSLVTVRAYPRSE